MKFKLTAIILFVLLILMSAMFVIETNKHDTEMKEMSKKLSDTNRILTEKTKENNLLYAEMESIIEENNILKERNRHNPRYLIRMACKEYDLDYNLAVSIARFESGNFTSDVFKQNNNVGGVRGQGGDWKHYNSLLEGVNDFVINLKEYYINQGLTTPELIQPKYCPNKQGGVCWLKQVKIIMEEEK